MNNETPQQQPEAEMSEEAQVALQTTAPSRLERDAEIVGTREKLSIWDALHIPKDVQESAKAIGDIVGAVSTAISWVGIVQSALKLVGFISPEPNPFDILYQRIQSDLKTLLSATLAGATEERLRDVAEQMAIARTAAQIANEYILLERPSDEFHVDRMALADRDSLQAMNVLAAPEWWQRSYDPSPAVIIGPAIQGPPTLEPYDYWWHPAGLDIDGNPIPASGEFDPPQPSGGLIWDYRHILPAYLQALAARIVVLRARGATTSEFLRLAGNEVPGYVAFLTEQYTRIKDNIKISTPPLPDQGRFPPISVSTGAVELYSGTHVWGFWHPFYANPAHPPQTYDEEIQVYNRFVQDCWRRVYDAVGLGDLQRVIGGLNSLLIPPCGAMTESNASASAVLIGCVGAEPSQHVFVTGSDGGLHVLWKPTREADWQWHNAGAPPGTRLEKYHFPIAIAYGEDAKRRIYAFMRTDTFHLYTYYWNGSAWNWTDQGKPEASVAWDPTVTTFQQGSTQHIRAYAIGTGKLQANWWDGSRWQWLDLGKPPQVPSFGLEGTPTAVTYRYNGRTLDDIYVLASGGLYEYVWYEDGQRDWKKPPQPNNAILQGTPAAVTYEQDGQPIVHVFATDMWGKLHSLEWNSGWHWVEHGAPPDTEIKTEATAHSVKAAVVRFGGVPNHPIAVVIGKNGRLYAREQLPDSWEWLDLRTPPDTTVRYVLGVSSYVKNGGYLGLDIFVQGENMHIYRTGVSFDNTWTDLGLPPSLQGISHIAGTLQQDTTTYATVVLTAPASSEGIAVRLTSSDPTLVKVPGAVTLSAGETTTTFPIQIAENVANTSVILTATANFTVRTRLDFPPSQPITKQVLPLGTKSGFNASVYGIAAHDKYVYAAHYYSKIENANETFGKGELVVIDSTTFKEVPNTRISVGFAPRSVAVNPLTKRLYVVNRGATNVEPDQQGFSFSIVEINPADASKLKEITQLKLGAGLVDVTVNRQTNRVYVTDNLRKSIRVVNGETSQAMQSIQLPSRPLGITVDENTNTLYVATSDRNVNPFVNAVIVVKITGETGDQTQAQIETIPIHVDPENPDPTRPTQPVDVAFNPETNCLYATNLGGVNISPPCVTVINLTTREATTVKTISGARAIAINPRLNQVYIGTDSGVQIMDGVTNTIVSTIPNKAHWGIAINPTTNQIYAGSPTQGTLTQIVAPDLSTITQWT